MTSATDAAATVTPPNLEKYLLQDDEVPGLEPMSSPQTDSGEPCDLAKDGVDRLRRSGYISTTYQPAEGDRSGGVSSVLPPRMGRLPWLTIVNMKMRASAAPGLQDYAGFADAKSAPRVVVTPIGRRPSAS